MSVCQHVSQWISMSCAMMWCACLSPQEIQKGAVSWQARIVKHHKQELAELGIAWERDYAELDAQRVWQLEEVSGDRRDLIAEVTGARDAAAAEAQQHAETAAEWQAATDRLRRARNGTAMDRQASLEEEVHPPLSYPLSYTPSSLLPCPTPPTPPRR